MTALYVGTKNAETLFGHSFRWCRDTAKRLGVPVLRIGAKTLIPAHVLAAAIERCAAAQKPTAPAAVPPAEGSEREREAMLRQLGLRRSAGVGA